MENIFKITSRDQKARTGLLMTGHGQLETPVFMPVGTHGAVKGVSPFELEQVGSQIILGNTYHLYLRPGEKVVRDLGDLHGFMGWSKPILTDSGGFQVFSLGERNSLGNEKKALRVVTEEGIVFKSHLDGSSHLFTPQKSIEIQQDLGADIIMAFDQPVYGMTDYASTKEAMERTTRWLKLSKDQWLKGGPKAQLLFGIVQGGTYTELHQKSAQAVAELNLPGNAIGGLSVGEGKKEMWEAVSSINQILPEDKPRYFMGLGEPLDLIQATLRGVDMYDCVSPSRLARHGVAWQLKAEPELKEAFYAGDTQKLLNLRQNIKINRINLHNLKYQNDNNMFLHPLSGVSEDLKRFSQGSLRHFVKESEMLGFRIITLNNIEILNLITIHLRHSIQLGRIIELSEIFS